VFIGFSVQLNGTGSASNTDILVYNWSLSKIPQGSVATLSDSSSSTPEFNINVEGEYVAELMVNDGIGMRSCFLLFLHLV